MQYVILRDEETDEVEVIGRFRKYGIGEIFFNDKWESNSLLYSLQFDGLLEEISEKEAQRLIAERSHQPQLQTA